jgi:elongator complex protein 2
VGRDRHWIKFDTKTWETRRIFAQAHARIIWDVSCSPFDFGEIFVTASRDKLIKLWDGEKGIGSVKFSEAVTACAFLYEMVGDMAFIAVGLENGEIYILGCKKETHECSVLSVFDEGYVYFWWS